MPELPEVTSKNYRTQQLLLPEVPTIGGIYMNRVNEIYGKLLTYHGKPAWWSDDPFEVMIGAVLVQNTVWSSVERVLQNFEGNLSPEYVESLTFDDLCTLIRPCGFYTAKASCLKRLTEWYKGYEYSVAKVQSNPLKQIRKELLAIKGIGEETADVILLYSFFFSVFVVDAYLKRLIERLQLPVKPTTSAIKTYFEAGLEADAMLYGDYHALILLNGKKHCRKKPLCEGCPLTGDCIVPFTIHAKTSSYLKGE